MLEMYSNNPLVQAVMNKYLQQFNPFAELDEVESFGMEVNFALAKNDDEYSVGVNVSVADEENEYAACGEATDTNLMTCIASALRMVNMRLDEEAEKAAREEEMTEVLNSLYTDRDLLNRRIREMEDSLGIKWYPY